jgi:hypothetical protein
LSFLVLDFRSMFRYTLRMRVYVVELHYEYEGDAVFGVFSTRKAANKFKRDEDEKRETTPYGSTQITVSSWPVRDV